MVEGRNLPGLLWNEPQRPYGFFTARCVEAASPQEATLAAIAAIKTEFAGLFASTNETALVPELHPEAPELLDRMPDEFANSGATWFPMDEG